MGIGALNPQAKLDVNGTFLSRNRSYFQDFIFYNKYKDTTLTYDRVLTISPYGKITPLRKARIDTMQVAKNLKIGDSSIYIGQEPGGENAIWSDNGDLQINPSINGNMSNTWLNPDGGRVIIGNSSIQSNYTFEANSRSGNAAVFWGGTDMPNYCITKLINAATDNPFDGNIICGYSYDLNNVPPEKLVFKVDPYGRQFLDKCLYVGKEQFTEASRLFVESDDADYAFKARGTNSNTVVARLIGANSTSKILSGGTGTTEAIAIDGTGGIKINSYSSTQKVIAVSHNSDNLDRFRVYGDGKVLATEIEVMVHHDFPDYVFEKSYELMPLKELSAFIEKHKHLPEIPTASEVAEQNLKLKEMNLLLLKKIEELTLYVIELNEKMDGR